MSASPVCRLVVLFGAALLLAGCASTRPAGETAPTAIVVTKPFHRATLHFPPGVYRLERTEADGSYYRAPAPVGQRTFGRGIERRGGIFRPRRAPDKLRWYAVMPYGLRKLAGVPRGSYQVRY